MAFRILCFLSFLAFSLAGVLPLFNPRIVNGEDAKVGEIPYQVSLQQKSSNFHFCGGSVLNENYVITAAYCVADEKEEDIQVIAGTIDLTDRQTKSQHEVVKIIVHEEYDPSNSWINDIALLKIKPPFKLSTTIGKVLLPPNDTVLTNLVAVMSGWGRLWQGGSTVTKLQRVSVVTADQAFCKYKYKWDMGYNVFPTQVCTNSSDRGPCHGDSGGPLTANGKLIGLVSWMNNCGSTVYPTVYTRVGSYLNWINKNTV